MEQVRAKHRKQPDDTAVMFAKLGRTKQQRAQEPKGGKGKKKRGGGDQCRVGEDRESVDNYLKRHGRQFASYERAKFHLDRRPMPARHCPCELCYGRAQGWPVGYVWTLGACAGFSYECGLNLQPDWFLEALPHSSSIVRFGATNLPRGSIAHDPPPIYQGRAGAWERVITIHSHPRRDPQIISYAVARNSVWT